MVARYQLSYRLKGTTETAGYVRIGLAVVQEETELGNDRGGSGRALMLAARCCAIAGSAKKGVATME